MLRHRVEIDYESLSACPLCGSKETRFVDELSQEFYRFGSLDIPYPDGAGNIQIDRCQGCELLFKSDVPAPESLAEILQSEGEEVWTSHGYEFDQVRRWIAGAIDDRDELSLLDVGASDGGMLRTFEDIAPRRSALDIEARPEAAPHVTGEYIEGFLEAPQLEWSKEPYDVVVACDVLEHLFRPLEALENLRSFAKEDGLVFIQTGDGEFPARNGFDLGDWWYANLFEHHIFWTEAAIEWAATKVGVRIRRMESNLHKDRNLLPGWKRVALRGLRSFRGSDRLAEVCRYLTGRDPALLPDPTARDHLTVLLEA